MRCTRIGDNTGFSVCILKNGEPFRIFQFKLNKNNTVFQAELAAIDFAVCWALENGVRINIHTDSQSSIKALRSARSRFAAVNKVKKNYYLSEGSVGLTWVKAHAGDPGNELADHHAKLATAEGEKLEILTPYSRVKFIIEKNLLSDWQETWDDYDSESGRRTRDFVPKIFMALSLPTLKGFTFLTAIIAVVVDWHGTSLCHGVYSHSVLAYEEVSAKLRTRMAEKIPNNLVSRQKNR
ncbi:hypothetical protein AVEN_194566-1 [Araneus ventricosus]|uniref:RNase H type-1 domain-containing protein n=1 Tax=Araneus ventricosus TaxID=182803 RepID=A0A4Y2A6H3_ARAVE|nr:hypothetical protein AVEN_194566-1 [Araneus ventricosus]